MIEIHFASDKHVSVIGDFQKRMAFETESMTLEDVIIEKGVKAVFNDETKGRYIVAEKDSHPVAVMMITPEWSDWRNGYFLWIQSLYVLPHFRKQGIFQKMYDFVISLAQSKAEYQGLRLYVDISNISAQEVYNKVGMDGNHYKMFEWIKEN